MIEMFSYEGILRKEAANLMKNEITRIFNTFTTRLTLMSPNPITKEELLEIKKYIEKDELTYEEALRFKELAAKLVEEYGREFPELWKIYWYAVFWVGASLRLAKERREKQEKKEETR